MEEKVVAAPILPIVPAVFVYVTNIKKSVDWYCRLLGFTPPEETRDDLHIFNMHSSKCSNIFLVRRDEVTPSPEPIFSMTAPSREAALQFLNELGIEVVRKDNDVIWFKDLDGNVLMACSI